MAGPGIGVWVKVRNKSGRMTARVIANKHGGGAYTQGQVITQSEFNEYRQQRAEAIRAEKQSGGDDELRRVIEQGKREAKISNERVKGIRSVRETFEARDKANAANEVVPLQSPTRARQRGDDLRADMIEGSRNRRAAERAVDDAMTVDQPRKPLVPGEKRNWQKKPTNKRKKPKKRTRVPRTNAVSTNSLRRRQSSDDT